MHPNYLRLRKQMERRVYEIARKHCGLQDEWRVWMETPFKKTALCSSTNQLRCLLKELSERQHLPDFEIQLEADGRMFAL